MFQADASSNLQAGFAVSNKNFKKAVDRNRIKRLMRETYRVQKNETENLLAIKEKRLAIFIIYTGNELPLFKELLLKMTHVLNRLNKIINENVVTNT